MRARVRAQVRVDQHNVVAAVQKTVNSFAAAQQVPGSILLDQA